MSRSDMVARLDMLPFQLKIFYSIFCIQNSNDMPDSHEVLHGSRVKVGPAFGAHVVHDGESPDELCHFEAQQTWGLPKIEANIS